MINIQTHGRDHVRETRSFEEIGYNLITLHTSIVILINEERLDDEQNL